MQSKLNISIDIKPTNHIQVCPTCVKQVKKGDKRVRVLNGFYGGQPTYDNYHPKCLVKEFNKLKLT